MADEEDGGEPADVAAAGELIERLNAAIDAVNDLEDELKPVDHEVDIDIGVTPLFGKVPPEETKEGDQEGSVSISVAGSDSSVQMSESIGSSVNVLTEAIDELSGSVETSLAQWDKEQQAVLYLRELPLADNDNRVIKVTVRFPEGQEVADRIDAVWPSLIKVGDWPFRAKIRDAQMHAVGHRVVHGGEAFQKHVRIDSDVLRGIEDCIELAPLHNPANLSGIRAARGLRMVLPAVGPLAVEAVAGGDAPHAVTHGLADALGEVDHAPSLLAGHVRHVQAPDALVVVVRQRRAHGVRAEAREPRLRLILEGPVPAVAPEVVRTEVVPLEQVEVPVGVEVERRGHVGVAGARDPARLALLREPQPALVHQQVVVGPVMRLDRVVLRAA